MSGDLSDILSLALEQTGVGSLCPPGAAHGDPNSLLNEAAGSIDDALLSSDIGALTQGLMSDLVSVRNSAPSSKPLPYVHMNKGRQGVPVPITSEWMDIPDFPRLMPAQIGSDIGQGADLDLLEENINLDELLGGGGPIPAVSRIETVNPVPSSHATHTLHHPIQRPVELPLPSTDSITDDDLTSLLSDTGNEFLESFSQGLNTGMSHTPFPRSTYDTSADFNGLFTSQSLSGHVPVANSTPTSLKFDVDAVIQQLSQPQPMSVHVPTPVVYSTSGKQLMMRGGVAATVPQMVARGGVAATVPQMVARGPVALRGGRETSVSVSRGIGMSATEVKQTLEEDSDDEDLFSAADTYANYRPSKLRIGLVHPDPVVESSSLSSVDPPQVWFDLKLPSHVIDETRLSSLQLEAVVYACQQHMNILSDGTRAGFLIGDGAGVGKGRTIAGIIYQNYLEGRKKALWLSVSNDLKYDAIRDLRDVGAKKIDVYSLNKFHYGKISGKRNGRVRKGVIFATYPSLIGESSSGGKYRTRFNQILHWLGPHYEGVIVFDECHKAKNLVPTGSSKPSKTGLTVLELQKKLPKARIVYCSATGASEPRNMAYMSRLGIWGTGTQFQAFPAFIKAVERRGVGAMEIVAMDMKLRGMYMARQLSFSGVTFSIQEVSLEERFIEMYDASVELWIEARKLFQEAADLMDYERKKLKSMWGQFWAAHQRFFKYLCIAAKVPETIRLARKALEDGKCVVIGLQSTGEARTLEQLEQNEGELNGFISTAKGVIDGLIRRHFPAPSMGGIDWSMFDNDSTLPGNCRKRKRRTPGVRRTPVFEEKSSSDDDSSSGSPEASDSAVESSSEDDDPDSDDDESDTSSSGESDGESGSGEEGMNLFGINIGSEAKVKKSKPKVKKRKLSPSSKKAKHRNFSIKPPPTSRARGKTKTGFNSKSLKFEPVRSPMEPPFKKNLLDRRQSIGVTEGIGGPKFPNVIRKPSLQMSMSRVSEGQSVLHLMSSSAMTTGSQSGLRNITVRKMKEELLRKLEVLSPHLPTNTLDELIDGLGGPDRVSEMTGRRGRIVSLSDGSVQYQLRSEADVPLEMLNIAEKQRFMDGDKIIAIISEAASSGISLQADRRVKNHKRRVHITLELPWSADKAIQQFGRTHRSNQVNAPEYIFLISELSGEQRFASIVAKRLESLGALTHGDRRATESSDFSKYNVDTKYGRSSLEMVLKSILGVESPLVKSEDYPPEFFDKCRTAMVGVALLVKDDRGLLSVDKDATTMSRFLNRILGISVRLQNKLFAYFTDTLSAIIQHAKKIGRWDGGILDFGASGEQVEVVETKEFIGDQAFCTATTYLHKVYVERGVSFSDALQKLNTDYQPGEGFYVSKRVRNEKQVAVLLKASDSSGKQFIVYRPNTGRQFKAEKLSDLQKKYSKVEPDVAEKWWTEQYNSSLSVCTHAFWQGRCRLSVVNHDCEVGLRRRTYHILSGSVLGVWTYLEGVFSRHGGNNNKMQIARVKTANGRLVGILIPSSCVEDMKHTLLRIALQAAGSLDRPVEV